MGSIRLLVIGLCLILLHTHTGLLAQEKRKKTYSFDVQLLTGNHRIGIFKTIDASNLLLKEKYSDSLISIPAADINLVKVRKVNAGGHIIKGAGITIGTITGIVLGFMLGYHSKADCNGGNCPEFGPELRGVGQGLLGGIIGGGIGSLLGNPSRAYNIDGKQENFEKLKVYVSP